MLRSVKYYSLFAMLVLAAMSLSAQTSPPVDNDDIQSWNDVSITKAVGRRVDLYFPVTFRFTKDVGRFNEGRIGAGVIIKPVKHFSISPVYAFIRARNSSGRFATENRLSLALVYQFPTKMFGLSHRSQFERRIRSSGNTWRYRPSLKIEKELPKEWVPGLKLFLTEEPFYDSGSGRFSRNRLSFGINKSLNKKLSLEVYYLRQDDNFSGPRVVHVIGTAWKVKL